MMNASIIIKYFDEFFKLDSYCYEDISVSKRIDLFHDEQIKWINNNFIKVSNGLMFDNTKEVNSIYLACFLSDEVISNLREINAQEALLITHHAFDIDAGDPKTNHARGFCTLSMESFLWLKENAISVYTIHLPLDINEQSINTHKSFCKSLGIVSIKSLLKYKGYSMGYIGVCNSNIINNIVSNYGRYYVYGLKERIEQQPLKVAVVAGMISSIEILEEIIFNKADMCVCGDVLLRNNSLRTQRMKNYIDKYRIPIICVSHQRSEEVVLGDLAEHISSEFKKMKVRIIRGNDEWK